MKLKYMKAMDHYGGVPICLFLDFLNKLFFFLPTRKVTEPRKILIMKFFGMGSILLSSPMIRALKQRYPDATIAFLTFSSNREIAQRLGQIDRLYTLRTDSPARFVFDTLSTLWSIRREQYDVTIDMEFFAKFSTIMTYLSGSPIRIGYFLRQIWRGDLLTHQIYYNQFKHVTEIFGALLSPLDTVIFDYTLQRPALSDEEIRHATQLLGQASVNPNDLLFVINVNASDLCHERRWPTAHFQTLISALHAELRATFVFIGGASEASYVSEVMRGLPADCSAVSMAGRTNLADLIALIQRADLLITNDSGPLHLAEALETPTVSFFGPEIPTLYGPRNSRSLVFYESIYCSPCLNVYNAKTAPCAGNNTCMRSIEPQRVLTAMRSHFSGLWSGRHDLGATP